MAKFLDGLVSHYVFDDGKLVVAHAGMKESMQGRGSGKVRDFALYGETTGETDEFGLAGPLQLGGGLSRQGARRLRSYAGPGAAVAQQHRQHRYRLRLRRPADGASLSGARDRSVRCQAPPTTNQQAFPAGGMCTRRAFSRRPTTCSTLKM